MQHRGPLSFLTFAYISHLIWKSTRRPLESLVPVEVLSKYLAPFNERVRQYLRDEKEELAARKKRKLDGQHQASPPISDHQDSLTPNDNDAAISTSNTSAVQDDEDDDDGDESDDESKKKNSFKFVVSPSCLPAILKSSYHYLIGSFMAQLLSIIITLYTPFVLKAMIIHLQIKEKQSSSLLPVTTTAHDDILPQVSGIPFTGSGVGLSLTLFVLFLLKSLAEPMQQHLMLNFRQNAQSLLSTVIFEKALRLSNSSSKEYSEGMIVSLISLDTTQVARLPFAFIQLFVILVYAVVAVSLAAQLIGAGVVPSAVVVTLAMVLMFPFSGRLSRASKRYQRTDDERLSFLRDLLMGIKAVKLRAFEEARMRILGRIREEQMGFVKAVMRAVLFLMIVFIIPQLIIPVASILVYANNNNGELDPAVVFPTLMYLENLIVPLQSLPGTIVGIMNGLKTYDRVHTFLLASEHEKPVHLHDDGGGGGDDDGKKKHESTGSCGDDGAVGCAVHSAQVGGQKKEEGGGKVMGGDGGGVWVEDTPQSTLGGGERVATDPSRLDVDTGNGAV
ncbi:ABC transporter C member 13, partial [Dinochytrium kinnereticum]